MHGPVIGQVIILYHLSSVCPDDSVKSEEIFQIELARIKSIGGPRGPFSLWRSGRSGFLLFCELGPEGPRL